MSGGRYLRETQEARRAHRLTFLVAVPVRVGEGGREERKRCKLLSFLGPLLNKVRVKERRQRKLGTCSFFNSFI